MSIELKVNVNLGDSLVKLDEILRRVEDFTSVVEFDADEMVNDIIIGAKGAVPVDTGMLRESIRAEGSFPNYVIIADAEDKYGTQYGPFVEYGGSKQEAQPFLWPVIYEAVRVYKGIILRDFRKVMKGV